MLTLNDGRSELWQWDTGRTLSVDADCSQVHFSNKVFGRSIDVDVVDGAAIIPDILLQTDKDLNVWAFVGTAENGYTKISKTFKVNRRNKPADYVFTPVEQTTIAEIAAIAQSVRDDADAGRFDGAKGPDGPIGPVGPKGEKGDTGATGATGASGADGKSAYQYAVEGGYTGTEEEFAAKLSAGSGLTTAQINALDGMFKVAAYDDSKDVSGAYAAFKSAFGLVDSGDTGGGGEEPPVVTTYTITAELVNVTSNNSATSVTEGASYTATLTAADGYALDTVTVTMGGVDVTADVYANGVISIASVTGNVEIVASAMSSGTETAELNTNGLLGYFDFRNRAASSGNGSTGYYESATVGDGRLYAWQKKSAGNEYGKYANAMQFCSGSSYTVHDFGTEFTWILKAYCDAIYTLPGAKDYMTPNNFGVTLEPKYNTSDSTATATSKTIKKVPVGYHTVTMKASVSVLKVYVDAALVAEYNGADIDGFVSWYGKFTANEIWATSPTVMVHTAMAFYGRALTDVEIVEMDEYLKTLEVNA